MALAVVVTGSEQSKANSLLFEFEKQIGHATASTVNTPLTIIYIDIISIYFCSAWENSALFLKWRLIQNYYVWFSMIRFLAPNSYFGGRQSLFFLLCWDDIANNNIIWTSNRLKEGVALTYTCHARVWILMLHCHVLLGVEGLEPWPPQWRVTILTTRPHLAHKMLIISISGSSCQGCVLFSTQQMFNSCSQRDMTCFGVMHYAKAFVLKEHITFELLSKHIAFVRRAFCDTRVQVCHLNWTVGWEAWTSNRLWALMNSVHSSNLQRPLL